jgi:hypothetical protein
MRRVGVLSVAPHIGLDAMRRHALESLVPVDGEALDREAGDRRLGDA